MFYVIIFPFIFDKVRLEKRKADHTYETTD